MTRLAVGRAFDGLDVDPLQMSFDGDRLSMSGSVLATSHGALQAARDRIVALTGNEDEKAVPVTFTKDPSVEGFYRPVSSSCSIFPHSPSTGHGEWSIDLERVGGGSTPQLEVYGLHNARTNLHTIDNAELLTGTGGGGNAMRVGIPNAANDFWVGGQSTAWTRTTASGDVALYGSDDGASIATFSVPPSDAYDGACHIRTTYDAVTNLLVGGHHAPGTFGDGWVLSNDLIRVFRHSSISTAVTFEVYDGTQWEALAGGVGWRLEHDYGGGSNVQWDLDAANVTILRNSPEMCSLRLAMAGAATVAQFGRVWLDLTVKRGERFVGCVAQCDTLGSLGGVMAFEPTSSIANTSLTGGVRATSNDAAGNRAVWGASGTVAMTVSGSTGRMVQSSSSATVLPFFIGVELTGSSAGFDKEAQFVVYEYYDTRSETQRAVRR